MARGFTLIELMIVVAIIGILGAIAYPSYTENVRRSKRSDAQTALMQASQWMQRLYAAKGEFAVEDGKDINSLLDDSGYGWAPVQSNKAAMTYNITVDIRDLGRAFTLTAKPEGTNKDPKCGSLTLTDTGLKGVSGGTGSVADCWK